MENLEIAGKKIFFLYPPTIVRNEVVSALVMQELEAYTVRDHVALGRILKRFPKSIVFVNLDEKTMPEKEWEAWICGVMTDPATAQTEIGILSSNANDDVKQKYLTQIKVTCGLTYVSTDLKKLISQISRILLEHEAMGRRKYIRVTSDNETLTTANMPLNGHFVRASIRDISSAGFSCVFLEDPNLSKGTVIPDIQLKLQSTLIRAEAIVLGSRADDLMQVYVFVFLPHVDTAVRHKIHKYIQIALQNKMDMELKK
ncbi:MAG: pilus assembly protein PilZ [Treponema sp.]|nr:pilus assembly protein PilZ [Treponema sp.]